MHNAADSHSPTRADLAAPQRPKARPWGTFRVCVLALIVAVTLLVAPSVARAQDGPAISSVSAVSNTAGPVITINGTGFGTGFPALDQATDSSFLRLTDTEFLGWNAGFTGDWCTVTVLEWTNTQIVVLANGIGTVTCDLHDGMGISATVWSTSNPSASATRETSVVAPPASVSSLSPDYGPSGGGTLSIEASTGLVRDEPNGTVKIEGSGFSGAQQVYFGTTPASSFTVVSSSEITAVPPPVRSAATVGVTIVTPSGSSSTGCLSLNILCSYGYSYLSGATVNSSVDGPVFDSTFSLSQGDDDDGFDPVAPCTGNASGSVDLEVTADASLHGGGYTSALSELPFAAALAELTSLNVKSLAATLTFSGNGEFECDFPFPPPLNVGGLAGLNMRVAGKLSGSLKIPYTITNLNGTVSGGFVGTTLVGPDDSLSCQGESLTLINVSKCASFTAPSVDLNATLETGPWILFGSDDFNIGAGPLLGAALEDNSARVALDACVAPVDIKATASGSLGPFSADFDFSSNPFGAFNIYESTSGANDVCPFGAAKTAGVLPPGAPLDVSANGGQGSAEVSWQPPTQDNGGTPTEYIVTPYLDGVAQTPIHTGSTATSYEVTDLADGSSYTFTVTAANNDGDGPASTFSNAVEPVVAVTATETAYVTDQSGGTVTPISNGTAGSQIGVGTRPFGVSTVLPDGQAMFVANEASSTVSEINTVNNTVSKTFVLPSGSAPQGLVIAPNGQELYVSDFDTNAISVVNLTTGNVTTPISLGAEAGPEMLALNTSGTQVYVALSRKNAVGVVSTSTDKTIKTIAVNSGPLDIVVNPNGSTAYVSNAGNESACGDTVTPINLGSNEAQTPIVVGQGPTGLAISPDGSRLYVSNSGACATDPSPGDTVSVVNTASESVVGSPITVGEYPGNLSVSSDGGVVYVPDYGNNGDGTTVSAINSSSDTVSTINDVGKGPSAVVFLPDQAPLAAIKDPSPVAGVPTTFSAAASRGTSSPVAKYEWNFGDGQQATTATPTTTHIYERAGDYTATVTAIDQAGTSTTETFNGQEVVNNGSNTAQAATSVPVTSSVSTPTVALSNTRATQTSTYTIHTTTSANGALTGGSTIAILFPAGTTPADNVSDYAVNDQGGTSVEVANVTASTGEASPTSNEAQLTLGPSANLPANEAISVTIAGVQNPAHASSDESLAVSTSADAAPTASAPYSLTPMPSQPQFGRCEKVSVGSGGYGNSSCTNIKADGDYQWFSGAKNKTFQLAGGTITLETVGRHKITCADSSGSGTDELHTVTDVLITFTECMLAGQRCNSPGQVAGALRTNTLEGTLGVDQLGADGKPNMPGLQLFPAGKSGPVAEATCGTTSLAIRGSITVPVTANKMLTSERLRYKSKSGKQVPEDFQNETGDLLEASIGNEPFEQGGIATTLMLTNQERLEVNAGTETPPTIELFSPSTSGTAVTINGVTLPTTPGATITSIQWSWGDGTTTTSWFPATHSYAAAGTYTVTVTATDTNGLTATATENISVT